MPGDFGAYSRLTVLLFVHALFLPPNYYRVCRVTITDGRRKGVFIEKVNLLIETF